MKTTVIIPSGGKGLRVNSSLPKQYMLIKGKELIYYTLNIFQNSPHIEDIIISAQQDYFSLLNSLIEKNKLTKVKNLVVGGSTRQESVHNALKSLQSDSNQLVIVHDAVRPFLNPGIISENIKVALEEGAAVTAIPAIDTLVQGDEFVNNYPDRSKIFYVQTPQTFKYDIIKSAFDMAEKENFVGTDESMIVKHYGFPVKIVKGSSLNIKITTKEDFIIADNIISNS